MALTSKKKTYGQLTGLPPRIKVEKPRIIELDFIKGISLILMVAVHFLYVLSTTGVVSFFWKPDTPNQGLNAMNRWCSMVFDSIVLPKGSSAYTGGYLRLNCLEVFFAGLFVFLAGISCTFSKNNLLRGLQLGILGELLTVFMIVGCTITNTDGGIIIGILHAMAIGIILYAIFDKFFPKLWQTFLAAIILVLFNGITMTRLFMGGGLQKYAYLPRDWWKLLLGTARWGDDYFSPVMVSAGIFLGASWGKLFYKDRKSYWPKELPTAWTKPICFLGRHTLSIYILHQPVAYLLVGIMYLCCGYTLR